MIKEKMLFKSDDNAAILMGQGGMEIQDEQQANLTKQTQK